MIIHFKDDKTYCKQRILGRENDWELRKFHGCEYSTNRGSTYNSYLIKEEKNVLIDTVDQPSGSAFISNLSNEIDFIIANHAEPDHSGALPELMNIVPDKPIYCTTAGIKSLKGHYHKNWNCIYFNLKRPTLLAGK